jgi:hypothetical protein
LLRAFLAGPDGREFLPQHGWWLAGANRQAMTFVALDPGGIGYVNVSFASDAAGWRLDSYGSCRARVVLANGLGTASWILDPAEAPPEPGDTEFVALVTEMTCASGQSSEGRIVPPTVLYEMERILVIFAVRPLPGAQHCPGNPATRYLVELKAPIGERRLLDGSFLPPHDPMEPLP